MTWIVAAAAWACAGSVTGVDHGPGGHVASIDLDPTSVTLVVGAEAPLQATARDDAGRVLTGVAIVWSVRDSSIARVSSTGVVSARSVGNTQIAASASGVSAIATLAVQPVPVASVSVQPSSVALLVGGTADLAADIRDVNGVALDRPVTWSSDNAAVASVSAAGVVTALAPGSATITAQSEGKSGTAIIGVSRAPVATITISPSSAALVVGGSASFVPAVKDASGTVLSDRTVSWSSSNPLVATVSAAGLVTAVAPGSTSIVATSEGVSATATVTVSPVPVGSVAVLPTSADVAVGQTAALSAIVRDTAGLVVTDRVVTWTSSDIHVAIVSTTGVVTGVAPGSATISASSEGKTGTSTVTVVAPAVASVTVQPATAIVQVGATSTLTATVNDVTGAVVSDRDVTWTSSNVAVASVSATGIVTGRAVGSAVISATSGGKSGSATVTVVAASVGSVAVSPASVTLVPAQVTSLDVVVRDVNDVVVTDRAVTWRSSNVAVATVSPSGVVTAVAPGAAIVTATSEGKTGSASITVIPMPVGSVAVSPATSTIMTGQTTALSATVRDTSGTIVTDRVVTWSSSDTTIATVSSAGVVAGVGAGTAIITATSEGRSATATVTVQPTVAYVIVAPSTVFLRRNSTVQLSVTAYDASGRVITGRSVTWSSDDEHIATVSEAGVVTARRAGTASITATVDGKSDSSRVTVTN